MRRANLGYENNGYADQQTDFLENENDRMATELSAQVKALKTVTIDIGQEVREQNKFINQMDGDFDHSYGFLRSTMGRVQAMAKAGHNRYIFYLMAFCVFVFFIIWLILKSR